MDGEETNKAEASCTAPNLGTPSSCTSNGNGSELHKDDDTPFFDALRAASRDYRRLCKEREEHEQSAALEAAAEARRAYFQRKEGSQGGKPITPSLWPYKKHYQKHLLKRIKTHATGRFCDIGSAPGGMTSFLCGNLHMTGYALSLDPNQGGFEMTFQGKSFEFLSCDMDQPDAWKDQLIDKLGGETFDFINLGVTLQWQKPQETKEEEGRLDSEEVKEQKEALPRDNRLSMQQILKNELVFVLHALADGGSFMITLPNSDHPNTFLYLKYLIQCTEDPSTSITFLPTPKLSRKPVYVLVQNVEMNGQGVQDFVRFLLSTDVSPENDHRWLVQDWQEALPSFSACRKSMERVWYQQLQELKKERRQAEKEHAD